MRISWTSTILAAVDCTSTSRTGSVVVSCMNAPVAFWLGTVARTHGSLTVTWAWADAPIRVSTAQAAVRRNGRAADFDSIRDSFMKDQDQNRQFTPTCKVRPSALA